MSNYNI